MKIEDSINWLTAKGFVIERTCAGKTRPTKHFALTDKAHDYLSTPINKRRAKPGMFEHTYLCHKLFEGFEAKGMKPVKEYRLPGMDDFFLTKTPNGKDINVPLRIDVATTDNENLIAYEVTLSMNTLILNVYKCFVHFNVDELHIVCKKKEICDRARERIENSERLKTYVVKFGDRIFYNTLRELF